MAIIRTIVQFKTRMGRGQSLLSNFNILMIFLGIAYIDSLKAHPIIAFLAYLGYAVLCGIVGYIDQKWGFWLQETHFNAYDLNPFNQALMAKIDNLRQEIQEWKNDAR